MAVIKEKVNINTIAKLAGVSTTTISNFINCTETFPISREKQQRIMAVMRECNYRVNSSSSMIRRKKMLPGKGVFVYGNFVEEAPFRIIQNPMLSQMLLYLSKAIMTEFGFSLEVRPVINEGSREEWNETLVDAEFVISYGRLNPMLYQLARRKNIPFVVISEEETVSINTQWNETPEVDFVYWDTRRHPVILLDHLRSLGVRRTFYLSSWNVAANRENFFAVEAENKIAGYRDYLVAHPDLAGEVVTPAIPDNYDIFYEIRTTHALLRARPEILEQADAILAHNDIVAQGVIAAMHERGLVPGRDIKVTGEGDFAEFRHAIPAVTTVTYDNRMMTRQVCDLIRKKMASCRYYGERIQIPSHIIRRDTT